MQTLAAKENRFSRWRWQLLGLALGAVLAVGVTPGTSWLVRQHLRLSMDPLARIESWTKPQMRQRAIAVEPEDSAALIARAILPVWEELDLTPGELESYRRVSAMTDRLYAAEAPYPLRPLSCAAYLRYAACSQVQILSAEGTQTSERHNGEWIAPGVNNIQTLARYRATAHRGETLEPDNAFFPAMLAAAHFAARQDQEGLKDLERAANKPRWKDYTTEEMQGIWRYQEAAYGLSSAAARIHTLDSISLYYNNQLQQMARRVTQLAMQQERAGNIAAGVEIRGRIMRLAVLMRDQGPSYLFTLTPTNLFQIARNAPVGEKSVPKSLLPDSTSNETPEQHNLYLDHQYRDFLNAHHFYDEANWFQIEMSINRMQNQQR